MNESGQLRTHSASDDTEAQVAYVIHLKVTVSNENSQILTLRLVPLSLPLPTSKVKRKLELGPGQNPVLPQHLLANPDSGPAWSPGCWLLLCFIRPHPPSSPCSLDHSPLSLSRTHDADHTGQTQERDHIY